MEYSKAGQIEQALAEFKTLIEKNPDYTPAYFMAAQALAAASRVDEAKRWLVDGISSARPHRQQSRAVGDDGDAGGAG
jgi:tetratricopeptide (TPR) repeat protein